MLSLALVRLPPNEREQTTLNLICVSAPLCACPFLICPFHPTRVLFVPPLLLSSRFNLYSPQSQITLCQRASLPAHSFWCNLYRPCVEADSLSVFFLASWLLWPVVFSSPSSLPCPCLAELVIGYIDWLAVGLIDPQGRAAGYWQMVLQCPPSIVFSLCSLRLLYTLYSIHLG